MMCSRRWYVTNREKIEEDRTARLEKEEADRIAQEEEARLVTSRHGTDVFWLFSNMHRNEFFSGKRPRRRSYRKRLSGRLRRRPNDRDVWMQGKKWRRNQFHRKVRTVCLFV